MAIATAGLLALISVSDARGFRRYFELQRQALALEAQNDRLKQHNQRLLSEISELRADPLALERAAREELGFVKLGEIVLSVE